jgi:hypothetical protein
MIPKRRIFLTTFIILILFSLACAVTGETSGSSNADQEIAEAVAQTLAAEAAANPPEADSPEEELPPVPDILFEGVSFSYDHSLAETVNPENDPGLLDGANEFWNIPPHLKFSFSNWTLADAFHEAVIRVYRVTALEAVNPTISEYLDDLQRVIDAQPADHEDIRVGDLFNAAQFIRSQVAFIEFQNGSGVRFLSQYGQAAWPIGWPHLFYTFQGLTDNGEFYISIILPVNHPSLPNPDDVVMDDAFYDNFVNYRADIQAQLNGEDPASFEPSLLVLDGVVETLKVENP